VKTLTKHFVAGALVISILVGQWGTSHAVLDTSDTNRSSQLRSELEEKAKELCSRFSDSSLLERLTQNNTKIEDTKKARESALLEKRQEWDDLRNSKRTEYDQRREDHYTALMERTNTDEQRQAVEAFKTSVENAVKVRRESQDLARTIYRDAIDVLLQDRQVAVEESVDALTSAVQSAVAKASASCTNGTPISEVRKNLADDLRVAREEYRTSLKDAQNLTDKMKALVDARKQAVETSTDAFKAELESARARLQTVFPN
jgi:hypothetical protein